MIYKIVAKAVKKMAAIKIDFAFRHIACCLSYWLYCRNLEAVPAKLFDWLSIS